LRHFVSELPGFSLNGTEASSSQHRRFSAAPEKAGAKGFSKLKNEVLNGDLKGNVMGI
jgi:hypothetical protein